MSGQETSYPLYSALWNGFYNRDFYSRIAHSSPGKWFVYLLFVVVLAYIPTIFLVQGVIRTFYHEEVPHIVRQVPDISIRGGKASSVAQTPVTITASSGQPIAMIDMTGANATPEKAGVMMLVTPDYIMARQHNNATKSYSFSEMEDRFITAETLQELADKFIRG